ncbi:5'-AMP-activated protein kinase subunit beta-1 [Porphyridium purpureum]|uniref:5'-AMP-activated protein kinase subunit beta-1 n=1 Tax=Porphyridium purpureum TaxID=35688 RepID=A0A5J4Z9Z1_PORPP|nr:5'-AMP-activated protein kinase subunit beta-1 [Porphyridium purpureum]|eukprot:POR3737..scf295_1
MDADPAAVVDRLLAQTGGKLDDQLQLIHDLQNGIFDFVLHQERLSSDGISLSDMATLKELLDIHDDFRKSLLLSNPKMSQFLDEHSHNTHAASTRPDRDTSKPRDSLQRAGSGGSSAAASKAKSAHTQRELDWWCMSVIAPSFAPPAEAPVPDPRRKPVANSPQDSQRHQRDARVDRAAPPAKEAPASVAPPKATRSVAVETLPPVLPHSKSREVQTEVKQLVHVASQTEVTRVDWEYEEATRAMRAASIKEEESNRLGAGSKRDERLYKILDDLKSQLKMEIESSQQARDECRLYEEKCAIAESKVAELEAQCAEQGGRAVDLRLQLDALRQERDQLERLSNEKAALVLRSDSELLSLRSRTEQLMVELKDSHSKVEEYQRHMRSADASEAALRDVLMNTEKSTQGLAAKIDDFFTFREALCSQSGDGETPEQKAIESTASHGLKGSLSSAVPWQPESSDDVALRAREALLLRDLLDDEQLLNLAAVSEGVQNGTDADRVAVTGRRGAGTVAERDVQSIAAAEHAVPMSELDRVAPREAERRDMVSNLLKQFYLKEIPSDTAWVKDIERLQSSVLSGTASWNPHVVSVESLVERHACLCIRNLVDAADLGSVVSGSKQGSEADGRSARLADQVPEWVAHYKAFLQWLIRQKSAEEVRRICHMVESVCRRLNTVEWESIYVRFFAAVSEGTLQRLDKDRERDAKLPKRWYRQNWYCVQMRDLHLQSSTEVLPILLDHLRHHLKIFNLLVLVSFEQPDAHEADAEARLMKLLLREASKRGMRVVREYRNHVRHIDHIWCRRALSGDTKHGNMFVRRDDWKKVRDAPLDQQEHQHLNPSASSSSGFGANTYDVSVYDNGVGEVSSRRRIVSAESGGSEHLIPTLVDGKLIQFYSPYGNQHMQVDLRSPENLQVLFSSIVSDMNGLGALGVFFPDVELWVDRGSDTNDGKLAPEASALFSLVHLLVHLISDRGVVLGRARSSRLNEQLAAAVGADHVAPPVLSVPTGKMVLQPAAAGASWASSAIAEPFDMILSSASYLAWLRTCVHDDPKFLIEQILATSSAGGISKDGASGNSARNSLMMLDGPFVDYSMEDVLGGKDIVSAEVKSRASLLREQHGLCYARMGDFQSNSEAETHKLHLLLLLQFVLPAPMALFEGLEFLMASDLAANVTESSSCFFAPGFKNVVQDESGGNQRMEMETLKLVSDLTSLFRPSGDDDLKIGEELSGSSSSSSSSQNCVALSTKVDGTFALVVTRAKMREQETMLVVGNFTPQTINISVETCDMMMGMTQLPGVFGITRLLASEKETVKLEATQEGMEVSLSGFAFGVFRLDDIPGERRNLKALGEKGIDHAFADGAKANVRPVLVEWVDSASSGSHMGCDFLWAYGSFSEWKYPVCLFPVHGSNNSKFATVLFLRPGQYELKFVVNNKWTCSKHMKLKDPKLAPDNGANNNLLDVEEIGATDSPSSLLATVQAFTGTWFQHMARCVTEFRNRDAARAVKDVLVPKMFTWTSPGAREVYICGSWNQWEFLYPLSFWETGMYHWIVLNIPTGVHTYRFLVDGVWCASKQDEHSTDSSGFPSNILRL